MSKQPTADTNFASGAVRSADANHLDFTSLPLIGLIGVARTAAEGAEKYGRLNYMQGMSAHDLLNHSLRHVVMHLLGDRSEPHLPHAGWGILAAIQSEILDPEKSAPHMLGPGATLTPANRTHLDDRKEGLAKRRAAGEFDRHGSWNLASIPEIVRLLKARSGEQRVDFDGFTDSLTADEFEAELRKSLDRTLDKTVPEPQTRVYLEGSAAVVSSIYHRHENIDNVDSAELVASMKSYLVDGGYDENEIELAAQHITANAIEASKKLHADLVNSDLRCPESKPVQLPAFDSGLDDRH